METKHIICDVLCLTLQDGETGNVEEEDAQEMPLAFYLEPVDGTRDRASDDEPIARSAMRCGIFLRGLI